MNCNIIQDILPLYIDHMVCDDTKKMVEEHLAECENCRALCDEIQKELLSPVDSDMEKREAEELRWFKKFLSKRKLRTIFLSVTSVMILIVGVTVFMNRYMRYIDYQEAAYNYIAEDEGEVYFSVGVKGNYRWRNELDRDTGIMTIYYEQSLWDRYIDCWFHPLDHIVTFLKKDMVKAVYIDQDRTETIIWEASEQEKENYFQQERGPLG